MDKDAFGHKRDNMMTWKLEQGFNNACISHSREADSKLCMVSKNTVASRPGGCKRQQQSYTLSCSQKGRDNNKRQHGQKGARESVSVGGWSNESQMRMQT
ncbi:hypothetical protein ATANTOWER_015524 [Ataeniobius toweri]|uniref:Uncharacterized protein n=1 Tax=Ataeniobius toweri TaxID=208326 RepID=A0ABU7ABN5_9TELE|nr:hypothetical protein [Ataeniobius toweri]